MDWYKVEFYIAADEPIDFNNFDAALRSFTAQLHPAGGVRTDSPCVTQQERTVLRRPSIFAMGEEPRE